MFKTPKQQVAFIGVSTLLGAFSLASLINFTDPVTASWVTLLFFYFSLFLVCLGTLTITGLFFRQLLKEKVYVVNLGHSFRQALLISVFVVLTFLLLANRVFSWWLEAGFILFLILAELFLNLKV